MYYTTFVTESIIMLQTVMLPFHLQNSNFSLCMPPLYVKLGHQGIYGPQRGAQGAYSEQ